MASENETKRTYWSWCHEQFDSTEDCAEHEKHCPACDAERDSDYDDYYEDDSNDPIGSCAQCEQNIYDDYHVIGGERLCDSCAWMALGCPGPNDKIAQLPTGGNFLRR